MVATDSVSRTHTHLTPSAHRALKLGVAQESQICAVLHAGDVDFNDHVYFPESRRELIHGLPAQTWLTTHLHTNLVTTEPPVPKLQNSFMIQLFLYIANQSRPIRREIRSRKMGKEVRRH